MTRTLFNGQLFLVLCCGVVPLNAANIAFDSAADVVYNDGWQATDNGGFGFSSWSFLPLGNSGVMMGSSTSNGDGIDDGTTLGVAGDRDIDTTGRSWGLFSHGPNDAIGAFRQLTGGPLSIGQSLMIDIDNGEVSPNTGFEGVQFVTSTDAILFRFEGVDTTYEVFTQGLTAHQQSTLGFADEGLSLNLLRTGSATFDLKVTLRNGNSETLSLTTYDGDVLGILLQNSSGGPSPSNDAYFNSMRVGVVPEPNSLIMALLGTVVLGTLRRRRSA